jgi:hypothetical protein
VTVPKGAVIEWQAEKISDDAKSFWVTGMNGARPPQGDSANWTISIERNRRKVVEIDEIEEHKPAIDLALRTTKLATQICRLESELLKDSPAAPPESASEEIASCAPNSPDGCESADVSPEGTSEPTDEVAEGYRKPSQRPEIV